MLRSKHVMHGLIAVVLAVAAAGCGGAAPDRSGATNGSPYVAPVTQPPATDPNQAVSTPPAQQPTAPQTLAIRSLDRGAYSGVTDRAAVLITDPEAWNSHWGQHAVRMVPVPAAPAVDFSQQSIVAVYMGEQRSGGYSVEITSAQLVDGKLVVTVRQSQPEPGAMTTMALTQPYHMVAIPKVPAGTQLVVTWQ